MFVFFGMGCWAVAPRPFKARGRAGRWLRGTRPALAGKLGRGVRLSRFALGEGLIASNARSGPIPIPLPLKARGRAGAGLGIF